MIWTSNIVQNKIWMMKMTFFMKNHLFSLIRKNRITPNFDRKIILRQTLCRIMRIHIARYLWRKIEVCKVRYIISSTNLRDVCSLLSWEVASISKFRIRSTKAWGSWSKTGKRIILWWRKCLFCNCLMKMIDLITHISRSQMPIYKTLRQAKEKND